MKLKTINFLFAVFIAFGVFGVLGILFGGCGPAAESFHLQECKKTPGDLYVYICDGHPDYARCLDAQGSVKYSECEADGVLCVADCP